jgi:hypothetical protein
MEVIRVGVFFLGLVSLSAMAQQQPGQAPKKKSASPPPPALMAPAAAPGQVNPNAPMIPSSPSTLMRPGGSVNGVGTAAGADVERMSAMQFHLLQPTAMVSYRGQSMTKSSFMARRIEEYQAQAKPVQGSLSGNFDPAKVKFEQQQAADLNARNARVQAIMDSFNQKMQRLQSSLAYVAMSKEAGELKQRYSTAPPSEQVKMKQRALELQREASRMEQSVTLKGQ